MHALLVSQEVLGNCDLQPTTSAGPGIGDRDPFFIDFPEFAQFRQRIEERRRARGGGGRKLKSDGAATMMSAARGGAAAAPTTA